MLSISPDKKSTASIDMTDHGWYTVDDYELEVKIMRGIPFIDFVLDDNGNVVDVTYTQQPPLTLEEQVNELSEQNRILEEQNQMLTDCILEMSEIVYGGDE